MMDDYEIFHDFFIFPNKIKILPGLKARCHQLLMDRANGSTSTDCLYTLLQDSRSAAETLKHWPAESQNRMPSTSFPLPFPDQSIRTEMYPGRMDIYCTSTDANMHNSWRLARCCILTIVAQTADMLSSADLSQEEVFLVDDIRLEAEEQICNTINDFCASIPYILSPTNTEAMLQYYPHRPGDAPFKHISEPDIIAGMSQMLPSLMLASQLYCLPRSQKQWLQHYLTMLSRNPEKDKAKALELELVNEIPGS